MKELDFYMWTKVLTYIHKHEGESFNTMSICKDTDIATTSTVSNIVHLLVKKGLIKIEKKGRRNILTQTKDGKIVAEKLVEIFRVIR